MERSLLPLNFTKGGNLVILTLSKDSGWIKHPGNPYFSQLRVEYEPSSRYYSTYSSISFHAGFQNIRDPWHLCGNQRRFSRKSRIIPKNVGKSWARFLNKRLSEMFEGSKFKNLYNQIWVRK